MDFSTVQDEPKTLEVPTSVIDYLLNINFRSASFQWLKAPESNAGLESTIMLKTNEAEEELFSTLIVAYFKGDALA